MNSAQQSIVSAARSYKDARWLHQGRTAEGIDCIGLVIKSAQDALGWAYDYTTYDRQAKDETMIKLLEENLIRVRRADIRPGDVIVFAFENQRHAGVIGDYAPVKGELSLIHAHAVNKKVVEQRLDPSWKARIVGAFRFPEAA